jgi:hypothetical protein
LKVNQTQKSQAAVSLTSGAIDGAVVLFYVFGRGGSSCGMAGGVVSVAGEHVPVAGNSTPVPSEAVS